VKFLVWSNEHQMWWRGGHRGYTPFIEEAGRYERAEAAHIVADATLDGQLTVRRTDPVTGVEYSQLSEVLVLAPESVAAVGRERDEAVRRCADLEQVREELAQSRLLIDGYLEDVPELTGRNAELVDRSLALKAELAKTEQERDELATQLAVTEQTRDRIAETAAASQHALMARNAELASARQDIEQLRVGGQS
jgi:hypothetical protein